MGDVKLIVGLGNPGTRYAATRHNLGFRVIDELSRRHAIDVSQEKFHAWFGSGSIGAQRAVLMKPTTFMNRSGQAVHAAGAFYRLDVADLLVISDDLALPLGKLRLRSGGSAGGQKGLGHIINRLGTDAFARLRIGIDPPVGDPVDYVLTRFSSDEQPVVEQAVQRAADAAECWLAGGVDEAMNKYNA